MGRDQEFQNLLNVLRRQIEHSYAIGEVLPSERSLASMHGRGPTTVHRAMQVLKNEGILVARPRSGWVKADASGAAEAVKLPDKKLRLRVGIITRHSADEWHRSEMYPALQAEAARRRVKVVPVPNSHYWRTTLERNRVELARVPWNSFDVGLLVDAEETVRTRDPFLLNRKIISIDQDATRYGLDSVTFADAEAGALVARNLFDLGHRRFALTDDINDVDYPWDPAQLRRRHGFESALAEVGGVLLPQWRLPVARRSRPGWSMHGLFKTHELVVRRIVAGWAAQPKELRPTALFCISHAPIANGKILRELARHDLSVPRDLSIVTTTWGGTVYGGTPAEEDGLKFTCVDFDLNLLVSRAFDSAAALHQEEIPACKRTPRLSLAPVKWVPGHSVGPPPK
jgi:DNA-binding LacI/PurR family transcriptional regulator